MFIHFLGYSVASVSGNGTCLLEGKAWVMMIGAL